MIPASPPAGGPCCPAALQEFYWAKLRDIELLCQTPVICDIPIMKKIQQILYAATADEGTDLMKAVQVEFAGREYTEDELPA
jgi:RP/EB family microtubule-associated protein